MELQKGMDFRLKQNRREVFLRFYEFHLRYRAHPGAVYQFIPVLSKRFDWDIETRLWYATLNGMTQYPMTSLAILQAFPAPPRNPLKFKSWFNRNWGALPFDADRKYQKMECPRAVEVYAQRIREYGSARAFYTGDFNTLWNRARNELHSLGRLGAWSGLEFVKIAAQGELDFTYNSLMLDDISGSRSHRNGLCLVLGRDDLDWHRSNPCFNGKYDEVVLSWLSGEASKLLAEARRRLKGVESVPQSHIGYETLESTLCCYKSWHRPNRRYPNVYNDMAYQRLKQTAQLNPKLNLTPFWDSREHYLPAPLRLECCPDDPGLAPPKQNFYRETGQIPMMDLDWDCFKNDNSWKVKRLF